MEKYLNKLLYGKYENRLAVIEKLAIPSSLSEPDPEVAALHHLAFNDGNLYIWVATEWILFSGSGSGASVPDLCVKVGEEGAPIAENLFWSNPLFANKNLTIFIGGQLMYNKDMGDGSPWFSKELASPELEFHNYIPQSGDNILVQIK